ncbi:DUF4350 domain-containing protein [Rufibacter immobilis]|uniref:DUF4350 domain-containing protein n=1 Tax=Rufibacter immobilis TaxID=1348778 RepID=UPI0035E483DA
MRGYKAYALGLGILFTLFVVVEYYRPKPIDWRQTFSNKDKIPYGTYVLFELLPDLFKHEPVTSVRLPVVNQVEAQTDSAAQPVNYLFVNSSFRVDSLELEALLEFVQKGNNAFISARRFPRLLQKKLGFEVGYSAKQQQDSIELLFTHPQLPKQPPFRYAWEKASETIALDSANTKAIVLGKNSTGDTNYVQIPFGKGNFYLSSVPLAFTNYHVINPRQDKYAALALSHLPVQPVWWDEYQKQGAQGSTSVFRVLLSHEALAWAYYVTLASLLLFVLFESKRTQRIIPVLEKPRNTTLEFVQVIGSLYFNSRDHQSIAEKKIAYFLEYLRLHYHEQTNVLDEELQQKIAHKSGVKTEEVSQLFQQINFIRATDGLAEETLWQLNKQLERFYRQTSR